MRTKLSLSVQARIGVPGQRVFVMLTVLAIALGAARIARAQEPIVIQDPAEFSAFQQCSLHSDRSARAMCLEGFLHANPESPAKIAFLDLLIDTYEDLNDTDHALSAATRLLEADPNNIKAIFVSVFIKKDLCLKAVDQRTEKSTDTRSCNDAATLAQRGLTRRQPEGTSSEEWKKLTARAYPVFYSAIAVDDTFSKRDFKDAIAELTRELTLYSEGETRSEGLWDTLLLASIYARPEINDPVKSIWFCARAFDFAPADQKDSIEKHLDFYYKNYHGSLTGLDEIKNLAETSVFPPESFIITPAVASARVTPQSRRHLTPMQEKPLAFAVPQATLPQAISPSPGTSIWPVNEKPEDAKITWDSHGLYIQAANSSLEQILKDVATVTGATVEGMNSDERIFGTYGPGKARDVLTELLQGTKYNVLMVGDQGEGTPREVVLSSKHNGGNTNVAANPNQGNDEDSSDSDDQTPAPPPVRPPFAPGGNRTPQPMRPQPSPPQQPFNEPQ